MTYSLAVIMMETSQSLSIFVPLIFTIIISNQTGYMFTRSLYQRACRGKQMPILLDKVPRPCKKIIAENIMTRNVLTLQCVDTLENISNVITTTNHHAFPIMNSHGYVIGIIPRNFIITLLKNRWFYEVQDENDKKLFESKRAINKSIADK